MNIIVAIIVRLKRAPECIKMHHLEGEHANFFSAKGAQPTAQAQFPLGRGLPQIPPRRCLFIRLPLALDLQTTFLDAGLPPEVRFYSKNATNSILVVVLPQAPLGELTVLCQTPNWILGALLLRELRDWRKGLYL